MMSRSIFRISPWAVWLLIVVMLCAALAPGVAVAKLERTIDTEGDPRDGLEGQGSSGGVGDHGGQSPTEKFDTNQLLPVFEGDWPDHCIVVLHGQFGPIVFLVPSEYRGAFNIWGGLN